MDPLNVDELIKILDAAIAAGGSNSDLCDYVSSNKEQLLIVLKLFRDLKASVLNLGNKCNFSITLFKSLKNGPVR